MSAFETVEREDVRVIFMRADADTPAAIQRAWAELERSVGLKGRTFFGAFHDAANEYRVCTQLQADDDPEALGFEVGTLPGGTYLRGRLRGEPPAVYDQIVPTVQELERQTVVDPSRPIIEFYRSRDVIDVLVPVG
jgi:DNA gyrase inhibitor GyrI